MTTKQKQLIYGSLMGDMSIQVNKGNCSPRLKVNHSSKQSEMVMAKYSILKEFVATEPKEAANGGWGVSTIKFTTLTQPWLKPILKTVIKNGRKAVSEEWLSQLTEEGVAWWFMDDGSLARAGVRLSTEKFTEQENHMLSEWFMRRWGIEAIVFRAKRNLYSLRFNKEAACKLSKMVEPFMLPSMRYKLYKPREANCENCGAWFLPREVTSTHCSNPKCRKEFNRKLAKARYKKNREMYIKKARSYALKKKHEKNGCMTSR